MPLNPSDVRSILSKLLISSGSFILSQFTILDRGSGTGAVVWASVVMSVSGSVVCGYVLLVASDEVG